MFTKRDRKAASATLEFEEFTSFTFFSVSSSLPTISEETREFGERVFGSQLVRNINELFGGQIIRSTTSPSEKNDLSFLSSVQQRELMLVIRGQIKNEFNEIIAPMQQQLVNLTVAFTKFVEFNSAVNTIDAENTSFDFSTSSADIIAILSVKLRAENVEYFDSDYKQEKKYSKIEATKARFYNLVVNVGKYIYYINVYTFLDKLKNLETTHDSEIVLNVVAFCFRGTTHR